MLRWKVAVGLWLAGALGCGSGASAASNAAQPSTPAEVAVASVAADPQIAAAQASDAPSPSGTWVGAATASDALVSGPQESFVAVWVDVPKQQAEAHAPAAVALSIDVSGSMAGDKIVRAREAAARFVTQLRDGDIVSVHSFADSTREHVPPTRLDATSRARIASVIAELSPQGGTNLFEGVRAAGLSAMSAPPSHPVRRVVLISDGLATVGTTSREQLANLGEKAGDRGVQVTAIGVGLDYDERTLNRLAQSSSGRLYHLADARALPEILQAELGLLTSTRATNARVAIVPAPGVQVLGVDGARSVHRAGTLEVPLGAMFAGQHKEFVVRVRFTAPQEGKHPLASVRFVYDDPTEGNLERVQEAIARFEVVRDPSLARLNDRAQGVFAMVTAGLVTERAAQAIDADRFDEAERELAQVEQRLRTQASAARDAKEKQRFEFSAEQVSSARKGASAAAQAPAAARPAAKRAVTLKANDAALDMQGF